MATLNINIIGCGRLGKTLGALIKKNNAVIISGIVNSSHKSAIDATNFIGQGIAYKKIHELPAADIYFITTRDDTIKLTCDELLSKNKFVQGKTIVHCSGSLTSDILAKAKKRNCYIASIHPIKSFADPTESIKTFSGTYCAIEGDINILASLKDLFKKIGANVFEINKNNKILYHAASVLSNNYVVALHFQALQCYVEAGIHENTANHIVSMLMTETLNSLKMLDHRKSLTGPIQRGDINTVKKHIYSLAEYPLVKNIYSSLGYATLPLTQHSSDILAELKNILKS